MAGFRVTYEHKNLGINLLYFGKEESARACIANLASQPIVSWLLEREINILEYQFIESFAAPTTEKKRSMYRVCINKRNGDTDERSYLMYADCLNWILESDSICSIIYHNGELCNKEDVQSDLELIQGIHNDIEIMRGDIRHHSCILGQ